MKIKITDPIGTQLLFLPVGYITDTIESKHKGSCPSDQHYHVKVNKTYYPKSRTAIWYIRKNCCEKIGNLMEILELMMR